MLIDVTNCSIQSFWYHNQIESTFADLKRSREISQDGVWASALDLSVAVHRISDADRLSGRNLYLGGIITQAMRHGVRSLAGFLIITAFGDTLQNRIVGIIRQRVSQ